MSSIVEPNKRYPWQKVTRAQWGEAWTLRRKDGEAAVASGLAASFSWPHTVAWACESFRRGLPRFVGNTPRTNIFKMPELLPVRPEPCCEVLVALPGQLRCGKAAAVKFGGHHFCKEHDPS